ncbi:MAG: IS3 family transposase [Candidatus Rokuibacteriota bacterium]
MRNLTTRGDVRRAGAAVRAPRRTSRHAPHALAARARADVELTAQLQAIHRESRGPYEAPRVHAELATHGLHVGRKRIGR